MSIVDEAGQKHDQWLVWSPDQRARVDGSYCYGDKLPFPAPGTVLERHLRIELTEANPNKQIKQAQCRNYGIFDSVGILVRVMRE
eukprot:5604633-Prorocentrum_lima.AAC.1